MGNFSFPKSHRLNREKLIKELFQKGSSFYLSPFKVVTLPHPDQESPNHQVLISVGTRNFKKAVDRNKIKRRIREGFRLNRHQLLIEEKLLIAYIYNSNEILPSAVIHQKLIQTFGKLNGYEKKS
jgi:ribonuclease P protein component, eubacterial